MNFADETFWLFIAPLPPLNIQVIKVYLQPTILLQWNLSDISRQDSLTIKICTNTHCIVGIPVQNPTQSNGSSAASTYQYSQLIDTTDLPKAEELTIKMSASSYWVESRDSTGVTITLSKLGINLCANRIHIFLQIMKVLNCINNVHYRSA